MPISYKFVNASLKIRGSIVDSKRTTNPFKKSLKSCKSKFLDEGRIEGEFPEAKLEVELPEDINLTDGMEDTLQVGLGKGISNNLGINPIVMYDSMFFIGMGFRDKKGGSN